MQTLQEYKCPCCGGAIAFDSTLQKMKCPFCDTEFEMDALKSYDAELQGEQADNMEWETSAGSEWQESEIEGLRSYVCKSGGNVLPVLRQSGSHDEPVRGLAQARHRDPVQAR